MNELTRFIEEILPILKFNADKATYIREREEQIDTGSGLPEYEQWAAHRSRIGLAKWEAIKKAQPGGEG